MFKPVSKKAVEDLRNSGSIFLSIDDRWAMTSTIFSVPHVIYYEKNKDSGLYGKIKLFTCYVSSSLTVFEISNLAESEFLLKEAEEASRYVFLEMVIENLIEKAKNTRKSTIILSSKIPHTAEILAGFGFSIQAEPDFDFTSDRNITFVGRKEISLKGD